MKNLRQRLKAGLTLLGLITSMLIVSARAAEFPELGVAPRNGGFRMEGYWVWCGSVIKGDDGRYHMFASRWPKDITFHPGWMTNSEIVRAVADRPEGPYVFQQVALPACGADYWDGRSTHNPSITRHGDTYILFYMGSLIFVIARDIDQCASGIDASRPAGNDKYQISNGKWKILFLLDFVIY